MNSVQFTGRLTKDPVIRNGGKKKAASYSIAVKKSYKREGGPDADFFNVVSFGGAADFIEKYFHKGMKIEISGEMHNDNYDDKKGNRVYGYQIITNRVEFGESKNASQAGQDSQNTGNAGTTSNGSKQTEGNKQGSNSNEPAPFDDDEFMNIPEDDGFIGVEESGESDTLPFN